MAPLDPTTPPQPDPPASSGAPGGSAPLPDSDGAAAPAGADEAAGIRAIRRRGWSVGVATGLYAISYGALATASGLDVWQAMVLSAVLFSGGSQFAFIGVIGGGGSPIGAALAAILLGVRNSLYGLILAPVLERGGLRGLVRSLLTIDESAATSTSGATPAERRAGFWAAGIAVWVFWNAFSLVGALAGRLMSDVGAWGLDAAAGAAFLGLLWPRLVRRDMVAVAVAAAFVALLTTPVLPAGLPVLAAALVAVAAGLVRSDRSTGRAAA